MKLISRTEPLPIAIDLGTHSLKLLQLVERGGKLSVLAATQFTPACFGESKNPTPPIEAVRDAMRQGEFRGQSVIPVLPREWVQVKTLRLPVLPEAELKAAIELESPRLFTSPADQLCVRFIVAGEVRQGSEPKLETIVLAVEQKRIEDMLERFNQIGLYVAAFDFEPCSIYRGVSRFVRRKADETEVNVLVDVGARQSQVVIGRGQEITFVKTIDIGGDKFSECVARKLNITAAEARSLRRRFAAGGGEADPVGKAVADATRTAMGELAHEVSLCLRYYSVTFRGQRPARVRLLGGEANDRGLRAALATSLVVPVEIYEPLGGIAHTLGAPAHQPLCEWGVALGASLRCLRTSVVREAVPAFGRRQDDSSVIEVVDLAATLQSVQSTPPEAPAKTKEADHA